MELQDKKIDMGCGADNFDGYLLWELADRQEAESGRAIIFKLRKV